MEAIKKKKYALFRVIPREMYFLLLVNESNTLKHITHFSATKQLSADVMISRCVQQRAHSKQLATISTERPLIADKLAI
jgi:hypothetical protein